MLMENACVFLVNTTREDLCELLDPLGGNYYMQVYMESIRDLYI